MITLEDCIGLCGLDADEVAAISEHEHIPEIAAAAMASYLLRQPHGSEAICTMIIDDIRAALGGGDNKHAAVLLTVLKRFIDQHPWACPGKPADRILRELDGWNASSGEPGLS